MIIDVLLPVGNKGGVENIIKLFLPYVKKHYDWKIRIIQLVWTGEKWLDEDADFIAFNLGEKTYDVDLFVRQYEGYLLEKGVPNLILASVWPLTCFVARKAIHRLPECSDIAIVSWSHAPIEVYQLAQYGRYSHLMLADVQLAISKYIYNEIESHLSVSNILMVKNPVLLPKLDEMICKEDVNADSKKNNLLFIGRISGEKSLETVILALKEATDWTLTIVGTGKDDYCAQLRELITECRVQERVLFKGWQSEPWNYAKEGDWLILTSLFEGFSLVTIEAFARGIPVIATPVGIIPEIVKPGETGYLLERMQHE